MSRWCLYGLGACALGFVVISAFTMLPKVGWGYFGATAVVAIAAAGYIVFIRLSRFCPNCGLLLNRSARSNQVEWCEHCEHLISQSLLLPKDGRLEIGKSAIERVARYDPVFELVSQLLFVLVDEDVDEAVLRLETDDYRFFATKDGSSIELEPPPREIHPRIVAIVKSIFEANTNREPSLFIHREYDDFELTATIKQSDVGECLTLIFNRDIR